MCLLSVSQVVGSRLGKGSSDVKTMGFGFQLPDYFCHLWMLKSVHVLLVGSLWEGLRYLRPVWRRGQEVLSSKFIICESSSLLLRCCNHPLQESEIRAAWSGQVKAVLSRAEPCRSNQGFPCCTESISYSPCFQEEGV